MTTTSGATAAAASKGMPPKPKPRHKLAPLALAGAGAGPGAVAEQFSHVGGSVLPDPLSALLWTGRGVVRSLDHFARMAVPGVSLGSVRTNHFPAADDLCNKSYLARRLNQCARMMPEEYDFFPRTWCLPQEWEAMRAEVIAAKATATAAATAATATTTTATAAAAATVAPTPPSKQPINSPHAASAVAAAGSPPTPATASPLPHPPSLPTYIFKPSSGSQGAGIHLLQRVADMDRLVAKASEHRSALTAQEYLPRPMLLGGLKFDLRLYVLLESLEPLRFHLFRDGLARFCTEEYQEPSARNLKKPFVHLTNSSLNARNEGAWRGASRAEMSEEERERLQRQLLDSIVGAREATTAADASSPLPGSSPTASRSNSSSDDGRGSKRRIRTVLAQLRAEGHSVGSDQQFWGRIAAIVRKTLLALWAPLLASYRVAFPVHRPRDPASAGFPSVSFHLLGFDILLDAAGTPWLLELNCSPSLGIDSALDVVLKKEVMEGAMGILGFLGTTGSRRGKKKEGGGRRKSAQVGVCNSPTPNDENYTEGALSTAAVSAESTPTANPSRFPSISISACNALASGPPLGGLQLAASSPPTGSSPRRASTPSSSSFSLAMPTQLQSQSQSQATSPVVRLGGGRQLVPLGQGTAAGTAGGGGEVSKRLSQPLEADATPTLALSTTTTPQVPFIPLFRKRRTVPAHAHSQSMPNSTLASPGTSPPLPTHAFGSFPAAAAATAGAAAPATPIPASLAEEQEGEEDDGGGGDVSYGFMEMCPEEDFLAAGGAAAHPPYEGLSSTPPHPLLPFQHPKLLALFERYTPRAAGSGSGAGMAGRMSSSKWMKACVAGRVLAPQPERASVIVTAATAPSVTAGAGTASPTASTAAAPVACPPAASSTTSSPPCAAPRFLVPSPLPHWPSRPDLDRIFVSFTRFAPGVSDGTSAGIGSGVGGGAVHGLSHGAAGEQQGGGEGEAGLTALDYAGFCDALLHIAETKYKPLLPHSQPGSPPPPVHETVVGAFAAGRMTPLQAFLHFVDGLAWPTLSHAESTDALVATTSGSPTGSPGRVAGAAGAGAAARRVVQGAAASRLPYGLLVPSGSTSKLVARTAPCSPSPLPPLSSPASHASLSLSLSLLLSPKDPSCCVFNRLQGVAPHATQSSSAKKRRKERELSAYSYETFLAKHQEAKQAKKQQKPRAKTNKK